MLTLDLNLTQLNAQLDGIVTQSEKAARLAARVGSQMYYEAVLATVPVSKHGHWFQGSSAKKATGAAAKKAASYWFESGSLKGAVYQVFAKESTPKHPEYQIAWNHRKVPYGFMVTYGTKRPTKPNPFIGRAEKTVKQQVEEAVKKKFKEVMSER